MAPRWQRRDGAAPDFVFAIELAWTMSTGCGKTAACDDSPRENGPVNPRVMVSRHRKRIRRIGMTGYLQLTVTKTSPNLLVPIKSW